MDDPELDRTEKILLANSFIEELPGMLKYYRGVAKLQKGYFDDLCKQGFTEKQALYLTDNMLKGNSNVQDV